MSKCERPFALSILIQVLKAIFRFIYARDMPYFYPPKRHVHPSEFLKPLSPPPHDLYMGALVDIGFEFFKRLPNRKINDDSIIVIWMKSGSVALFSLKPPDKSGASIGESVDLIEGGHELGHNWIIQRRQDPSNIYLGNVILRICHSDNDSSGGPLSSSARHGLSYFDLFDQP